MPSASRPRKQLSVDRNVQGALALRVVLYWCACLAMMTLMLVSWRIVTGSARLFYHHLDEMWFHYGPALLASFVLLPLVVVDVLRLSNRFAGPMVRLQGAMRALARGQRVAPIHFRENDFWREFADAFNALAARVQGESGAASVSTAQTALDAISAAQDALDQLRGGDARTTKPGERQEEEEEQIVAGV